ncbi:hypothetical protein GGTG_04536 [Gaeumannomyces tritici R3-111a-1]|uniref:CHAT domain-containing protein n=1 Tax=Gaeumannomyces tritici (strain R3-111a-1) TaxID=644352 RepID=J3NTD7_GAET3|nr:hypothetical protein GGTG_04536 [Gaeumannomyces tritici R3-111a-1]EJT79452.1 hypothetical protein GGTG_04536 [Gaeumannomyces tritici R3-111a-1]
MAFTLRISGLGTRPIEQPADGIPANPFNWTTEFASSNGRRTVQIADPLLGRGNPASDEDLIKWCLEKHVREPFEATKADSAGRLIREYGQALALQVSSSGLLPVEGHLEIEVGTPDGGAGGPGHVVSSLQRLHWEVVEDVTVWPENHKFQSVGVCRTTTSAADTVPAAASAFPQVRTGAEVEPRARKHFNILLVVSRPGGAADVEYQLVSRCLVDIADRVSKASPDLKVVLEVLRPPTWAAFQARLSEDSARRYDLVHLDMHGAVRKARRGVARAAALCFCGEPNPDMPLESKKDWVSGEQVAKVLSKSGVRTIVMNACESANSRREECGGNLAAILLAHHMDSVVAMSFKVVDEAVEIFTDVFYTSLLLNRRPVKEAARLSRLALLQNPQRRALHMYSVRLMDYIVPVLYRRTRKDVATDDFAKAACGGSPNRVSNVMLWNFAAILWNFATLLWNFASLQPNDRLCKRYKGDVDHEIVGRDADILHLESALSARGLMLLYGQGGCGKTALMRYCAKWWERSGWIEQSATVDFVRSHLGEGVRAGRVCFHGILDLIATQLRMPLGYRSEQHILDKLRGEACLLVLDSLESLSRNASELEAIEFEHDGLSKLREFVLKASGGKSKIVLVSRHGNDPFIDDKCRCVRYQISGLSVLAGAQLFEQLAYGKTADVPKALHHRQNIDLIRRAVILLEGNPAVLKEVGPVLRRLGHDMKALYDKLLFGVCEIQQRDGQEETSRFAHTIACICGELEIFSARNELVFPFQVAPFWTIAPRNPQYYFWFLYLEFMKMFQEGSYAAWLTDDFRTCVEQFQQQHDINRHWGTIFRRFEAAGLAEEATIKTNVGTVIRCYHVHPMLTLRARAQAPPESWGKMKSAFVRQFLLWLPKTSVQDQTQRISSVTWDDFEQHDDYAENIKAMAMAFALDGPDFQDEVKRMGCSLFDYAHLHSNTSFFTTARRAEALLPLVRRHLERLFKVVDARAGKVPTSYELGMIMDYSWECYTHEEHLDKASDIVGRALEVLERYRALIPSRAPLTATQDFDVFQLRYAEACIVNRRRGNMDGMEYFQRNLEEDVGEDHDFYAAIRRIQWRNLREWTTNALDCMSRDMPPQRLALGRMQAARQLLDNPSFREDGIAGVIAAGLLDRTPVKESIAPVIEANQGSVARFGKIAHRILNESAAANFADFPGGLAGLDAAATSQASDDPTPETSPLQFLQQLLRNGDNNVLGGEQARADMSYLVAQVRMLAGRPGGVEGALDDLLEREAPSSTSSSGWKRLAELHHDLYFMAVPWEDASARDYHKGLRHLDEYWRLLQNEPNVPNREMVYTFVKYAVCYNGIGRVLDAARAVLKAVPLVPLTVHAGECVNEMDAEEFDAWVYQRFAELNHLDVFLDWQNLAHPPREVEEMSLAERSSMFVVMTRAKQIQRGKKRLNELVQEALKAHPSLRQALGKSLPGFADM